jgi:hypothetical protein
MPQKLYLDSRDLINVLSRNDPVTPDELRQLLTNQDVVLVYSFSNVIETVAYGNLYESRRRLDLLDSMPKIFIMSLPPLIRTEFAEVQRVMGTNAPYQKIAAFRDQWLQTLEHHPVPYMVGRTMVDEAMLMLFEQPRLGRNTQRNLDRFREQIGFDRLSTPAERRKWTWFVGSVHQIIVSCGWRMGNYRSLERLARCIYDDGSIVPGWRLSHFVYAAFCDNVNDHGECGDPPDYSHVTAAPYVDAMTLDNRMRGYYRSAIAKLQERYPNVNYYRHRAFRNLESWLAGEDPD